MEQVFWLMTLAAVGVLIGLGCGWLLWGHALREARRLSTWRSERIAEVEAEWRRECDDTDKLLKYGMGWSPDVTRTEGGSLKVIELAEAMRALTAPGSGG